MKNIEMKTTNNILTIKIDLSKTHGPSSSGKTTIVASTQGNKPIDGFPNHYIGINCYTK